MSRRNHRPLLSLLTLSLFLASSSAPLRAQQPRFKGSMFGEEKKEEKKKDGAGEVAREAEPAPSPVSYMRVVTRVTPAEPQTTTAPAQTTPQQPAPSANNPPPQTGAPAQGPQTASPTQSQTQQSTNPAAPAQRQQPAQPSVPPTAPADANLP